MESVINPGLMKSLTAFHLCRQLDSERPFLAGLGNVTEFIDSDTSGVNGLLACLGIELGISVFLTTEERASTIYSTKELQLASQMSFAAKFMNAAPRDLGFSAFQIKSSYFDPQTITAFDEFEMVIEESREHELDSKGCFRIAVDRDRRKILCQHRGQDNVITNLESEASNAIIQAILTRGLVSDLAHASYLGTELTKAEICMKSGHNYVQDEVWELM
jgi:dihydropteroate synthase-like protein